MGRSGHFLNEFRSRLCLVRVSNPILEGSSGAWKDFSCAAVIRGPSQNEETREFTSTALRHAASSGCYGDRAALRAAIAFATRRSVVGGPSTAAPARVVKIAWISRPYCRNDLL